MTEKEFTKRVFEALEYIEKFNCHSCFIIKDYLGYSAREHYDHYFRNFSTFYLSLWLNDFPFEERRELRLLNVSSWYAYCLMTKEYENF